ncbi:hypothetical protein ACHAXA_002563 [Cyclostephanos tholiformis]|uniref:Uncharacterized protein n=1 Tax=Cyclostephanos tholiformis TaxID=382380 RepID=A0ABD3R4E5_9STRA
MKALTSIVAYNLLSVHRLDAFAPPYPLSLSPRNAIKPRWKTTPNYATTTSSSSSSLSSSSSATTYDLVVIGGGSSGLTAAKFARTFGKTVCLVECSRIGGDCTWTGCVPSKTLLHAAKRAWTWRKMNERYGEGDGDDEDVSGGGRGIMNDACMLRMLRNVKMYVDANRERIYEEDDSPKVLRGLGMDLALGRAPVRWRTLRDPSPGRYMFDRIRGLDDVPFWTYENLWDEGGFFDAVERNHMRGRRMSEMRVIVVGGGPVGCELSQSLSRLGCSVVLICGSARLLPNGEMEASAELKRVFKNEGIDVICDQRVVSVVSLDGETVNRSIMATLESHEPIIGDHILIATGRVPNVERMGLDDIGVKINPVTNGIIVDEKLQTSVKGVYAAGDCTGDRQFTHYAGFQGAIAARNILLPLKDTGVLSEVPSTTFTDPEVASFGLTEQAASDKYGEEAISISFRPLSKIDRAICEGSDGLGFIKIVYKTKSRQILGATVMAPSAGELVSELTAIQAAKMPLDKLATVMHSYPSYSIALQQMAAEVYYDKLKKNQSLYDVLKRAGL